MSKGNLHPERLFVNMEGIRDTVLAHFYIQCLTICSPHLTALLTLEA